MKTTTLKKTASILKIAAITLLGFGMFLVCGYSILLEGDNVSPWAAPLGMLAGFLLTSGAVILACIFSKRRKDAVISRGTKNRSLLPGG